MKLTGLSTFCYALITICLFPRVTPGPVNQTIDDAYGDSLTGLTPNYWPDRSYSIRGWGRGTCYGCSVMPDASQMYNGTYHDNTYLPQYDAPVGVSMQFTGTAIYVFFTLPNYWGTMTMTSTTFEIDTETPVLYYHTPTSTNETFQYQALVFSRTGLSNTLHILNIWAMGNVSYMNFDYAIYTQDDSVSAPSSSTKTTSQNPSTSNIASKSTVTETLQVVTTTSARTPVGAIVGGVAGGVVVFLFAIFLLFSWRRRRGRTSLLRDKEGPGPLITQFRASPSALSGPGMTYAQYPVDLKASTVTSQFANQTDRNSSLSAQGGRGPSQQSRLPGLLGDPNDTASASGDASRSGQEDQLGTREPTREEIRRARQEELDKRLRMVLREMEQLAAGPEVSLGMRGQQTSGATGGHLDLPASDVGTEIRLMREQIQLLREQQRSAWAQGLSDDPPPGYAPMQARPRSSREVST